MKEDIETVQPSASLEDRAETFFHAAPKFDDCSHEFKGWREFEDGRGGEQVCTKCGIGAMAYTLRAGL